MESGVGPTLPPSPHRSASRSPFALRGCTAFSSGRRQLHRRSRHAAPEQAGRGAAASGPGGEADLVDGTAVQGAGGTSARVLTRGLGWTSAAPVAAAGGRRCRLGAAAAGQGLCHHAGEGAAWWRGWHSTMGCCRMLLQSCSGWVAQGPLLASAGSGRALLPPPLPLAGHIGCRLTVRHRRPVACHR